MLGCFFGWGRGASNAGWKYRSVTDMTPKLQATKLESEVLLQLLCLETADVNLIHGSKTILNHQLLTFPLCFGYSYILIMYICDFTGIDCSTIGFWIQDFITSSSAVLKVPCRGTILFISSNKDAETSRIICSVLLSTRIVCILNWQGIHWCQVMPKSEEKIVSALPGESSISTMGIHGILVAPSFNLDQEQNISSRNISKLIPTNLPANIELLRGLPILVDELRSRNPGSKTSEKPKLREHCAWTMVKACQDHIVIKSHVTVRTRDFTIIRTWCTYVYYILLYMNTLYSYIQ